MFLVPMHAPGVSIRRRPTASGWTLSDVHFDAVSLGPDALLGTLHGGWSQLLSAVGTEGGGIFHVGFAQRALDELRTSAVDATEFGKFCAETAAAQRLALRAIPDADRVAAPPAASAMAKVYATELLQRIARFSGAERDYVEWVHPTIGGGTNEMKRTQIARSLLAGPGATTTIAVASDANHSPATTLAAAADMAGAAGAALELAVERARERHQFGRPIGEFQAIAHRLADAAIDVTVVDLAVDAAALALEHDDPQAPLLAAQAKALANEALPASMPTSRSTSGTAASSRWPGSTEPRPNSTGSSPRPCSPHPTCESFAPQRPLALTSPRKGEDRDHNASRTGAPRH
jgi:hypothetical protein